MQEHNQLAIRLDNPPSSSRWYPGGGIYRNVWLTKTQPLHVAQWGIAPYIEFTPPVPYVQTPTVLSASFSTEEPKSTAWSS